MFFTRLHFGNVLPCNTLFCVLPDSAAFKSRAIKNVELWDAIKALTGGGCDGLVRQTNGWHHLVILCASFSIPVQDSCRFYTCWTCSLLITNFICQYLTLKYCNTMVASKRAWLIWAMIIWAKGACLGTDLCNGGLLQAAKTLLVCLSSNSNKWLTACLQLVL